MRDNVIERGIYTTFWLEASSPQAKMWSEPLAPGRQNAHHSCPAGRDLCRADPSTRGATAPQRAQQVNLVVGCNGVNLYDLRINNFRLSLFFRPKSAVDVRQHHWVNFGRFPRLQWYVCECQGFRQKLLAGHLFYYVCGQYL